MKKINLALFTVLLNMGLISSLLSICLTKNYNTRFSKKDISEIVNSNEVKFLKFSAKTHSTHLINIGSFMGSLVDLFVGFIDDLTSPFRPVWGAYKEVGENGHPGVTTFYRKNPMGQVNNLRNGLNKKQNLDIYQYIIDYANYNYVNDDDHHNQVAINARTAKCAAFVALVGKKADGTDLSNEERLAFRDRAMTLRCVTDGLSGSAIVLITNNGEQKS